LFLLKFKQFLMDFSPKNKFPYTFIPLAAVAKSSKCTMGYYYVNFNHKAIAPLYKKRNFVK
ncbi:hypothetical protein, partial [Pedobacter sp. UBA4863]|uniref:hypothetical protein n=1 Tax=Pedobacter sp. UBA4863 TaxID=1947060 RepID=UPI0025FFD870